MPTYVQLAPWTPARDHEPFGRRRLQGIVRPVPAGAEENAVTESAA